jgi:hypothetical protein
VIILGNFAEFYAVGRVVAMGTSGQGETIFECGGVSKAFGGTTTMTCHERQCGSVFKIRTVEI